MSRRTSQPNSRVRGPNSALTEFLREKGVSAQQIQAQARRRYQEAEQQRQQEEAAAAAAAIAEEDDEADDNEDEEPIIASSSKTTRSSSRYTRKAKIELLDDDENELDPMEEDDDDDEDEEEEEAEIAPSRGRRRGRPQATAASQKKAQPAKTKSVAGRKRKLAEMKKRERAEMGSDSEFEAVDLYKSVPVPGQIAFCAECNCRFTVTPYSKEGPDGDGLLCHACGKKSAPIEAAARKKKQTTRTNKKSSARALLDLEATGVKTLQEMCIQLVAKHIEDVEALGNIGSHNLDKICQIISKNRSLNNHTMQLFMEPAEHVLSFYDCSKIESDNLQQIGAFVPTLRRLHLKFCGRMRDDCLDYYGTQLKQLHSIELYGAFNVTEECYVRFFKNVGKKLKEFGVGDTARFKVAAMEALVDNCPDLEVLRLRTLANLDDECLRLLTGLPNLQRLEISDPSLEITDQPVIDILNTCGSGLKELNLNGCNDLTDAVLEAIHESCGNLEILSLEELELVSSEGVNNLFRGWDVNPGLTEINISRCINLEPPAFNTMIAHSQQSLEKLNINSCKELNSDAWSYISTVSLPSLVDLDVSFIRSINDDVAEELIRVCPELKVIRAWGCHKLTESMRLRDNLHLVGREADILS